MKIEIFSPSVRESKCYDLSNKIQESYSLQTKKFDFAKNPKNLPGNKLTTNNFGRN